MQLDALQPGARLGDLVILRQLGRGGMGTVYEAREERLDRLVAVKVPSRELMQSDTARERFEREAKAAAGVVHANVVAVHTVAAAGGWPYLVLEHLPGGSLRDVLRTHGGRVPWREVCALVREVALGLEAIHARGLVHRDLKPVNVLLDAQGRPKVADFGLVRQQASALTHTGEFLGTATYMSPEQIDRPHQVGPPADLYALGCVLHELLTGAPPFPGGGFDVLHKHLTVAPQPVRAVIPDAPPELEALVLRLLAKSPDERPASARAVVEALDGILRGRDAPARSSRAVLAAGIAVAVCAAGLGAALHLRSTPPPTPPTPEPSAATEPPAVSPTPTATEPAPPVTPPPAGGADLPWSTPQRVLERLPAEATTQGLRLTLLSCAGGYRFAHAHDIHALALTPRGLLSADGAGRVVLWSDAGEELGTAQGDAHLAASGRRFVTCWRDEPLRLWDLDALEVLEEVETDFPTTVDPTKRHATSVALSADGRVGVVSCPGDRKVPATVLAVDFEGGRRWTLSGAGYRPVVAISEDGRTVFAADRDGQLLTWDLGAGESPPPVVRPAHRSDGTEGGAWAIAVGPSALVTGGRDALVKRWSLAGAETPLGSVRGKVVTKVGLDPGGRRVVAGDDGGGVVSIELGGGRLVHLDGHRNRVQAVAVRDETCGFTAGDEGTIRRWDLVAGTPDPGQPRASQVRALGRSPDGVHLPVARVDGAELWRLEGDRGLRRLTVFESPPGEPSSVALSASLDRVLLGTSAGAFLFRVGGGTPAARFEEHASVRSVALPPDGSLLVGTHKAGVARFERSDGERVLLAADGRQLALSGDGATLVVACKGQVAVSPVRRERPVSLDAPVHTLPVAEAIAGLSASEDGRTIGVAADGRAWLWKPAEGPARPLPGRLCVAVSDDGLWWATGGGSSDGDVLVGSTDDPTRPARYALGRVFDGPSALQFVGERDLLVGTRRGALLRLRLEPLP